MASLIPEHLKPPADLVQKLRRINSHNVHTLRHSPLSELSGSLGDLGTLLPLLVALAINRSIYLAPTLIFTGVANIFTGVIFGIPLPVQPMKAIAAVAIAKNYSVEETMASGLSMGIAVGFLTITGLLGGMPTGLGDSKGWGLMTWVPVPVVKGIQVGAGLSLCISAGDKLLGPLHWLGPWWGDNLGWALVATAVILVSDIGSSRQGLSRIPAALVLFALGLLFAVIRQIHRPENRGMFTGNASSQSHAFDHLPSWPRITIFLHTFSTALGQLPLTTLNSILAVTYLAADLYPADFPPSPSPSALGFSIMAMNLLGCAFGAMPTCHGSGGLAGQYKFGARSGASVILLGFVKLALGIVAVASERAGKRMIAVLDLFPKSLLGIMVIAAGLELAKVGAAVNDGAQDLLEDAQNEHAQEDRMQDRTARGHKQKHSRTLSDEERKERYTIMLVTVAALLAFRNDGIGFIVGMLWHWTLKASKRWTVRQIETESSAEERQRLLA